MSWYDQAACAGRTDIDWFPEFRGDRSGEWRSNLARAREVCDACPVSAECITAARLDPNTAGIWAGTTESQRRRSPERAVRRPQVARCGTDAGYYRHLRQTRTEPCVACLEAHAMAWRIRKHQMAVVR